MKAPIRFDEYYLVERIAVGGMAEVFKGITYSDEGFERLMAVKRVLPHIAEDQDFIEMFIDEAKLVSQLQHPNIPQVYHLGKCDDQFFISMEFISGQDLRSIFDRGQATNIKLDLGICAHIIMEICEALDYAHRKTNIQQEPLHLIHRDVSPQNIIVSYDGTIKLIDFGIAKVAGKINQTQAGILKGKFSYMSPEQARGYTIDARSDLFGLGAVLYELVTLERCFLGQTDFSTIERVRNSEYRLPRKIRREIPAQLEKIVRKALSKDPDHRFQSAADFQEALSVFVRTHQLQRSREQVCAYMSSIFNGEIRNEIQRMNEFRAYATEHIPQAQRHHDSRRFNQSHDQFMIEQSRPRFALENELKLSLDPHSAIAASTHQKDQYKVTAPQLERVKEHPNRYPSRKRLILIILLAILTGSLIAAVSWIQQPLVSGVIFEDSQGLNPKYTLVGDHDTFRGVAPDLVEIDKAGSYQLEISLPNEEMITQTLDVQSGQILKISSFGETRMKMSLLTLSSSPSKAQVILRGKVIGETPLKLQMGGEKANILIRSSGYQEQKLSLTTKRGQNYGYHVNLVPRSVETSLYTSIEGAKIASETSEGSNRWRVQGINQIKLNLENSSAHRLRISADGYVDKIIKLEPSHKRVVERWVALKPLAKKRSTLASLKLSSLKNSQSSNLINEITPNDEEGLEERITKPQIKKKKKAKRNPIGKIKQRRKARRRSTQRSKKRLKRTQAVSKPPVTDRQPGFLKLIAIPPAEAFIGGKSVGWTPLINLKLPEGIHRIKLRYQSGEEKTLSQTISAGRVSLRRVKK